MRNAFMLFYSQHTLGYCDEGGEFSRHSTAEPPHPAGANYRVAPIGDKGGILPQCWLVTEA